MTFPMGWLCLEDGSWCQLHFQLWRAKKWHSGLLLSLVSLVWGNLPDSSWLLGKDKLSFWTWKDWLNRRCQTGITQPRYVLLWQGWGLAVFSSALNSSPSQPVGGGCLHLTVLYPTASSLWHMLNKILSRCPQIFHPGLSLARVLEVAQR